MHIIHCYAAPASPSAACRQSVQAIDRVLQQHFHADYALYYEQIPSYDAPPQSAETLYIMVASLGGALCPQARSALAADLYRAVPKAQNLVFCSHEADAAAYNGQYLLDLPEEAYT